MANNQLNSPFEAFVGTAIPPYPPELPLVHVTEALWGKQILLDGLIKALPRNEFSSEELAFFFYGAARYKSAPKDAALLHAYLPMAFVMRIDFSKTKLRRVFPFDSGAFVNGRYVPIFHPALPLDDFLIGTTPVAAQKCVQTFYDSNSRYLKEKLREPLPYPATNFHVNSYVELISHGTPDHLDHRRSAIEFQINDDVAIKDHEILGVVVPERFLDDSEFVDLIQRTCKISPQVYAASKSTSDYHYGSLCEAVRQLVEKISDTK